MSVKTFDDNIQLNANKALDNRVGVYNNSQVWVGYANVNSANAALDPSERHQGLTVLIVNGQTIDEYWYKDGIADNQLVLKNSGVYTVDNGISPVTVDGNIKFQLGGNLTKNTTIDTTNNYKITINGTKNNDIVLDVIHNASGGGAIRATDNTSTAIQAVTQSGVGINSNATSGQANSAITTSGTCYNAFSTNGGKAANLVSADANINTALEVIEIGRQKYGTSSKPTIGFGAGIGIYLEVDDTGESSPLGSTLASKIETIWNNAIQATRTSEISISLINSGVLNKILTIKGNGDIIASNIRVFADDTAADTDSTLVSKSLYKIVGSRIIYQKP